MTLLTCMSYAPFVLGLIALAWRDYRTGYLPDRLQLPLALIGAALAIAGLTIQPLDALLGAAIGGGVLLLLRTLTRGGLGLGDVKLGAVIGLWLGIAGAIIALLAAFIAGGVVGAVLLARGRGALSTIPFGPFLAGGGIIALATGDALTQFYLGLL